VSPQLFREHDKEIQVFGSQTLAVNDTNTYVASGIAGTIAVARIMMPRAPKFAGAPCYFMKRLDELMMFRST
jgi:hypothetical protein